MHTEEQWKRYAITQPTEAGVYQWRLPLMADPSVVITFYAHHRLRGAGREKVLSPNFDHWDGYRVHVPKDTEWRDTESAPECKFYQTVSLDVKGITNLPCPFCGEAPKWKAAESRGAGGVVVGAAPHQYNSWWLECCWWSKTPHYGNPVELAAKRNALIAQARGGE